MAERTCSTDGCVAPARARGLCWKHYKRLQRAGGVVRATLADRLWRQIKKRPDGCWEWVGTVSHTGYGRILVDGRQQTVHRVMYELVEGPVPGLQLDHLCHTRDASCAGGTDCPHRRCCNPAHLDPVTPRENWIRGESPSARNARKSTCLNGHPFAEATWNGGRRYCPTCANERTRRWRERNRT